MNKNKIILFIVPVIVIAALVIGWDGFGKATLVANQVGSEESKDFTLHIRVEKVDQGIKVFRSLQYLGKEPIEIEHQTPLISVSLGRKNHDFTGSKVKEVMKNGDSYYPQKAKIISVDKEGKYTLFCLAEFQLDGKKKKIEHTEQLIFE